MSPAVIVLLLLAGLSESAGRILPLLARRAAVSRVGVPQPLVFGLLLTGAVVDCAVFALWPLAASALAEHIAGAPGAALAWTPVLVAPLVLAAVIAFPLIGPLLHALLILGVGASLVAPLAATTGLAWWPAAACLAGAGLGLAAVVYLFRRLVARITAGVALEVPA